MSRQSGSSKRGRHPLRFSSIKMENRFSWEENRPEAPPPAYFTRTASAPRHGLAGPPSRARAAETPETEKGQAHEKKDGLVGLRGGNQLLHLGSEAVSQILLPYGVEVKII